MHALLQNLWLRRTGIALLILLALLPAFQVLQSTLVTTWNIAFPSLYLDQWDNIAAYFAYRDAGQTMMWLFSMHNEHQIVLPRLLFLADWSWFGADNKFLLVWIFLNQLVFLWVFHRMLRPTGWPLWMRSIVLLLSIVFLFSSTQLENLSWGFQVQFVNVYLFALLALWSFANHIDKPTRCKLFATVLFAFMASFSMSNGMLVWPLLGLLCLFHTSWTTRIVLAVAFAANLAIYLSGTRPPGEASSLDIIGTLQKVDFYRYVGIYLSNPLGKSGFNRAILMSGLTAVFFGLLLVQVWRQRIERPEVKALIAGTLFIAGTAVFTALGRSRYGLLQATAERYTTPALLFLACVCLLSLIVFASPGTRRWVRFVVIGWLGMLFLFGSYLMQKQGIYPIHYTNKNFKKMVALNAIREGVADRYHFAHLHPNMSGHHHTIAKLKEHPKLGRVHQLQYHDPETHPLPSAIGVEVTQAHFLQTERLEGDGKGWILYGGFRSNIDFGRIPLLLQGASGSWVASGYLVHGFEPIWPLSDYQRLDGEQNFYLHMGIEALEDTYTLFAQFDGKWIPLGMIPTDSVARPQTAVLRNPPDHPLVEASMLVMEADPHWQVGGAFPSAPEWKSQSPVYGSWSGSDNWAGSMRVKITLDESASAILLPLISGPINPNAIITLIDAESLQVLHILRPSESPEQWKTLRMEIPEGSLSFYLIVAEEGRSWGQWLAFAAPLIVP